MICLSQSRKFGVRSSKQAAFTMVEIALSLAVIGFALVAIIGVLPTGISVQKDNREETIINQDGVLLLEMIRSGAEGLDYLTNHVFWISRESPTQNTLVYSNFASGREILGYLSAPSYEIQNGVFVDGIEDLDPVLITARLRAISGNALLKGAGVDSAEFDLNYLLTCQIYPKFLHTQDQQDLVGIADPVLQGQRQRAARESQNVFQNFFEVRLQLDWPVFDQGGELIIGPNSKSFRTMMGGRRALYENLDLSEGFKHLPNDFIQVNPQN